MNVMSLSKVRTTNVYARLAGHDILIMLSDSVCNKHYCNIIHIEIELIKTKFRSTDIFIHTYKDLININIPIHKTYSCIYSII